TDADLVVADHAAAAALGRAIEATPAAAAAIVQCLRAGAALDPMAGLMLESITLAALQGSGEHARWLDGRRSPVLVEPGTLAMTRTNGMLDLRIDRPAARNAIDRAMRDALFDAFTLAAIDRDIARIRLTATGRCFGIGADLAEFGTTRDPLTAHRIRLRTLPAWPLLRRHGTVDVHVQGACIGSSLELAAFADRLTATSDAWFQLPECAMGIMPGFGGTVSIPRRIGRQRAAKLMLSGRRIGARAAMAIGLIDAIVDDPAGDDRRVDALGR
ncbi:enoyl-CoA hydratase/isomerase family protein, partial [uncultured Sphingomonas sp.]|uniref:enoyl-CoA hydratase/isomerase family protein n=1 Tax=uncultured Sphingomonas sp. TaxID=158754 RepID=UPI0026290451